jgi:hypothetical protein
MVGLAILMAAGVAAREGRATTVAARRMATNRRQMALLKRCCRGTQSDYSGATAKQV